MYVGLKQPRGDGERYVTPARAAAKETIPSPELPFLGRQSGQFVTSNTGEEYGLQEITVWALHSISTALFGYLYSFPSLLALIETRLQFFFCFQGRGRRVLLSAPHVNHPYSLAILNNR